MTTDYQKQGEDFLKETGTEMSVKFVGNDYYFDDDKETRDIYRVTLTRRGKSGVDGGVHYNVPEKSYTFRFGRSINKSARERCNDRRCRYCNGEWMWKTPEHARRHAPTAYDVLTCLTKSDPGTIDDFADEYGYQDIKPSKLMKIYSAVVEEWESVRRLFGDVMEKLQEVQ